MIIITVIVTIIYIIINHLRMPFFIILYVGPLVVSFLHTQSSFFYIIIFIIIIIITVTLIL